MDKSGSTFTEDLQSFEFPLAELHAHLTAAIHPALYWKIAHNQGFKLPKQHYNDFYKHIALSVEKKTTMKEYFDTVYHPLLNKLSSGTFAVEEAVYEILSGAYRVNNITVIELRTNPMKHNFNGEVDLDNVIMAMLRGMERALLEYSELSAGIIFCLDRQFTYKNNEIIVDKAIKYRKRGVVAIDFANYDTGKFKFKDYVKLVDKARDAGLKITTHTGETNDTNDMWDAINYANPLRIGHGIKAAYDKALMKEISKRGIVLEVCPISNISTTAVKDVEELKFILRTFINNNVKFCINSDWPEIIKEAHLRRQLQFLRDQNILSDEEIAQCTKISFESTFIPGKGLAAYL